MHAAIDGRSFGSGLGGDETMLRGFVRGLALHADPDDAFTILASPTAPVPISSDPRWGRAPLSRTPGPVHFSLTLPAAVRRLPEPPDVVLSVTHSPPRTRTARALMVNDISFLRHPEHYPRLTRARLTALVKRQIGRVEAVLTVSQFCRNDILQAYRLDAERVHVVPNTIDPPRELTEAAWAAAARRITGAGVDKPFVLYLGNLHARKNVQRLIRAFATAQRDPRLGDCQLVVAGASWFGSGAVEAEAASAAPDSVVFLGRVSDDEREYLLRTALGLAYVSLFEGFGLPPLEAMARGTPVLASATTAIPEVVGDAGVLVEPTDVGAIAEGLRRILTDDQLRSDLSQRGPIRAKNFEVERTGARAVAALRAAATS